jgi:hypothetical protein
MSYPMQGVLNFIIFIRPKYLRIRTLNTETSFIVALGEAIWNPQGKIEKDPAKIPNHSLPSEDICQHDVMEIAHPLPAGSNSVPISAVSFDGDQLLSSISVQSKRESFLSSTTPLSSNECIEPYIEPYGSIKSVNDAME